MASLCFSVFNFSTALKYPTNSPNLLLSGFDLHYYPAHSYLKVSEVVVVKLVLTLLFCSLSYSAYAEIAYSTGSSKKEFSPVSVESKNILGILEPYDHLLKDKSYTSMALYKVVSEITTQGATTYTLVYSCLSSSDSVEYISIQFDENGLRITSLLNYGEIPNR